MLAEEKEEEMQTRARDRGYVSTKAVEGPSCRRKLPHVSSSSHLMTEAHYCHYSWSGREICHPLLLNPFDQDVPGVHGLSSLHRPGTSASVSQEELEHRAQVLNCETLSYFFSCVPDVYLTSTHVYLTCTN